MHRFSFPWRKKAAPSPLQLEQNRLLTELRETKCQLEAARSRFQSVSDLELIAASVYEINALQAQYSYLLHQAKLHELRCAPRLSAAW